MPEGPGINPTIIAAVCGLLGAIAGAGVTGYFNQSAQLSVERAKFEADLILQAIDTEDQATAIKTLKFFADAGLIPSYEEKIRTLAEDDEGAAVPTLRTSPAAYRSLLELPSDSEAAKVGRSVGLFVAEGYGRCTAFLAEGHGVIVPRYCLPDAAEPDGLIFRLGFDAPDAAVEELPIAGIEQLDAAGLAVLSLQPDAARRLSALPLRGREPVPGEAVFMVHHPRGGPKQLSDDCHVDPERPISRSVFPGAGAGERPMLLYTCRSEGGSAGAPVVAASDGAVLGIHVAGTPDGFERYAVPVADFLAGRSGSR
ncbi:MAG TPA: serine protease [Geminicoccaceae bacterium]